jgi:hypothetical protein
MCREVSIAAVTLLYAHGIQGLATAQTASSLPQATLHVEVFDAFGHRAKAKEIRLHSLDHKHDLASSAGGEVIKGVPYGEYQLAAWDRWGNAARRKVTVNTPEVWVFVGITIVIGDHLWPPGDLSVHGEVRPVPGDAGWWLRIEGVYTDVKRDTPVSAEGQFSIGGLEEGAYLVELFEGPMLRHVEPLELNGKRPDTALTISATNSR